MLMLQVLDDFRNYYNDCLGKADPRVVFLPMAQSPGPFMFILLLYLIVVHIGPKLMEQQKPFNLKWVLVVYNSAMVLFNLNVASRAITLAVSHRYSLTCQLIDHSDSEHAREAIILGWLFFVSKLIELSDTVFFILRKKNSQISFLHVYHHTTIVVVTWSGMKWVPGGQSFMYPILNTSVHVIMYIYYAISALGPQMQKYLWWKRYLTIIQLTQFGIIIMHTVVNLLVECEFPKLFDQLLLGYILTILALFLNFYFIAYIKGKRKIKPPVANGNKRD